jgi:hypothetical protein
MASSWDLRGRCNRTKRRGWLALKAKEALLRCRVVPSSVALETAVVEPRGDGARRYLIYDVRWSCVQVGRLLQPKRPVGI